MRWFGPHPFSLVCLSTERAPVPFDVCPVCEEPFDSEALGYLIPHNYAQGRDVEIAYHVDCFMSLIVGRRRVES